MFNFLGDLFSNVINGVNTIFDFFLSFFNFLPTLISFIPTPFREITLIFLGINVTIFVVGLIRGDT